MKLVIDRKKWLRGEGSDASFLLRSTDKKMCCLGFLAQQSGCTEQQIHEAETLAGLTVEAKENLDFNLDMLEMLDMLANINDDMDISDAKREKMLKIAFKEFLIEVEFV